MPRTLETGIYDVTQLAELLGITPWETLVDQNPDAWGDHYRYGYDEAIRDGMSEDGACEAGLDCESKAIDEEYRQWRNALVSTAETYLEWHGLSLTEITRKTDTGYVYKTFKVTSSNWDDAATKIMETINGVGYFYFSTLKIFKDSIPVRSSRQLALMHLHHIKWYGEVYGEYSPKHLMEIKTR